MDKVDDDLRRTVRHLAALPDAAMRRASLAGLLEAREPADAVRLIAELYADADPVAVTALAGLLADDRLDYERRAALYQAAKDSGHHEVARLLLATHDGDPRPGPEQPARPGGPAITLGQRKSLARARRRDRLAHLLRDPDVGVVENLLGNPMLTERDVVAMAARRPARADVLRLIAGSRWVARYHVKRALVLNPHTPREVALRLLGALNRKDREEIARNTAVDPELRVQARALTEP